MIRRRTKKRTSERGSSILECGLTLSAFLMLVLGIIGIGRVLFVHQTLSERARSAVRYAAPREFTPAVQTAAQNIVLYGAPAVPANGTPSTLFGLTRNNVRVKHSPGSAGSQESISVYVESYQFEYLVPGLPGTRTGRVIVATLPMERP